MNFTKTLPTLSEPSNLAYVQFIGVLLVTAFFPEHGLKGALFIMFACLFPVILTPNTRPSRMAALIIATLITCPLCYIVCKTGISIVSSFL